MRKAITLRACILAKTTRHSPIQYFIDCFARVLDGLFTPMNKPTGTWWLRYSLKFSLVLLTSACVVLGLNMRFRKTRNDELSAIQKLAPSSLDRHSYGYQEQAGTPPGPKWIRDLIGDDEFFARVQKFELREERSLSPNPITDLNDVAVFKEMECLSVYSSGLKDISGIWRLGKLRECKIAYMTPPSSATSVAARLPEGIEFSLEAFGNLPAIESISVSDWNNYNVKLNDVDVLVSIPNLKHLLFDNCELTLGSPIQIDGDPHLPSLQDLTVQWNNEIESLGVFSSAPQLETLNLKRCDKLSLSDSAIDYPQLKKLVIENCPAVEDLDGFKSARILNEVEINQCSSIKNLDGVTSSKNLESATIIECPQLANIEVLYGKDCLKTLELTSLPLVESFDGTKLRSLETFKISNLQNLASIRLADAADLNRLVLYGCPQVKEIELHPQVKLKRFLIQLSIDDDHFMQCIQSSNETLSDCWLTDCKELTNLDSLHDCKVLDRLTIHNLDGLTRIGTPTESAMQLSRLWIKGCQNLKSLEGIEAFNATRLNIDDCDKLEDASQIAKLSELEFLEVSGCKTFEDVNFLRQLTKLKSVTFRNTLVTPKTARQLARELSIKIEAY